MSDSSPSPSGPRPVAVIFILGVAGALLVAALIVALAVRTPRDGASLASGFTSSSGTTAPTTSPSTPAPATTSVPTASPTVTPSTPSPLAVSDCASSENRCEATDGTYTTLGKDFSVHPFTTGAGMVAVATARRQVTLFDAATGKKLQTWTLSSRFSSLVPARVLPDRSVLVDGYIKDGERFRLLLPDGRITKPGRLLNDIAGVNPVNGNVVSRVRTTACKTNVAVIDAQTQTPCGSTAATAR